MITPEPGQRDWGNHTEFQLLYHLPELRFLWQNEPPAHQNTYCVKRRHGHSGKILNQGLNYDRVRTELITPAPQRSPLEGGRIPNPLHSLHREGTQTYRGERHKFTLADLIDPWILNTPTIYFIAYEPQIALSHVYYPCTAHKLSYLKAVDQIMSRHR